MKAVVTVQEQKGLVVVTMTNGSLEGDKQPDHYALIPTGTSLLNWKADPEKAVFNGEAKCILRYISYVSGPLTVFYNRILLLAHIATIEAYLNAYRTSSDIKRKDISIVFSHYLVLGCWRKMQKQVGHWTIICLISQLALIPHGALLCLNMEPSTQTDGRLMSLLLCINTNKHLVQTLSHYRPNYIDGDDIPLPLSVCKEQGPLYTKATTIEFHCLMVGALIAYAAHLARKCVDQEYGLIVPNDILLHTIVHQEIGGWLVFPGRVEKSVNIIRFLA